MMTKKVNKIYWICFLVAEKIKIKIRNRKYKVQNCHYKLHYRIFIMDKLEKFNIHEWETVRSVEVKVDKMFKIVNNAKDKGI